ncbi:MAG: hypothetical protein WC551_08810 [Patescibacteria group bacterium]
MSYDSANLRDQYIAQAKEFVNSVVMELKARGYVVEYHEEPWDTWHEIGGIKCTISPSYHLAGDSWHPWPKHAEVKCRFPDHADVRVKTWQCPKGKWNSTPAKAAEYIASKVELLKPLEARVRNDKALLQESQAKAEAIGRKISTLGCQVAAQGVAVPGQVRVVGKVDFNTNPERAASFMQAFAELLQRHGLL